MAQKARIEVYDDGSVIVSNLRNNLGVPIIGLDNNLTATRVTQWWDGTNMDESKVDNQLYIQLKALPSGSDSELEQYIGDYFKVNLPNDGELFLEKNTMAEMRGLSPVEILLLRSGYYRGVKLNGYYAKGDTPAPIEYRLSTTSDSDDGGSVIEVGAVKLEHIFIDLLNVSYFGIQPGIDFTTELNLVSVIAADKNLSLIFNSGEYLIDGTLNGNTGFTIPSNSNIITEKNTIFKCIPNSSTNYAVITIRQSSNIYINKLKIEGDRENHNGTTGEWGMGLNFLTASDVRIDSVEVNQCWGDGVYFGKAVLGDTNSNIIIGECKANRNRRQGISFITGRDIVVNNAKISFTGGTAPGAGVDFEPNHPEDMLNNITLNDISTNNNIGGGILMVLGKLNSTTLPVNIKINGHTSREEATFPIRTKLSERVLGKIVYNNLVSDGAPTWGINLLNYINYPDIQINNPTIYNANRLLSTTFSASGVVVRYDENLDSEEGYKPRIEINNPSVISLGEKKVRYGIYANNDKNPTSHIENLFIKNPYIVGAQLIQVVGGLKEDVVDELGELTRSISSANYTQDYQNMIKYYNNSEATASRYLRLSPTYSKVRIKIENTEGVNFGVIFLGGIGHLVGLSTYDGMRLESSTKGNYIIVEPVDGDFNTWRVVEGIGTWILVEGSAVQRINFNGKLVQDASVTQKGVVNKISASSDTAEPSVAEPTKEEFDALLNELRDLKTKMRSAGLLDN